MLRTPRTPIFPRDEPSQDASSYQPLNQTGSSSSRRHQDAVKENQRKYRSEEEKLKPWYHRRAAMVCLWITGTMLLLWFASLLVRPAHTEVAVDDDTAVKGGAAVVGDVKGGSSSGGDGGAKEAVATEAKASNELPPPLAYFIDEDNYTWGVNTTGNISDSAMWYTCKTVDQAIMKVQEWKTGGELAHVHRPYYFDEPQFVDPSDDEANDEMSAEEVKQVCDKTMTYVLGTAGKVAGMGPSLMAMWLAYGLAKKEGREFFIDDSEWEYGKIDWYFSPPAKPKCKPPPKKWMTPCPHMARHLIVSYSTTHWTFGHTFMDEFEDARKMGVERLKPIYDMIRHGYLNLFQPSSDVKLATVSKDTKNVVVHIRRGDVKPREFDFSNGWLPLQRYLRFAFNETVESHYRSQQMPPEGLPHYPKDRTPMVYLSSDDGSIITKDTIPSLIKEGKLEALPGYKSKYGFTADEFKTTSADERRKLGEGYVADLKGMEEALEGGGWAVCDLQATMCRILAVAMGWELAVEHKHWINIDGQFDWFAVNWN